MESSNARSTISLQLLFLKSVRIPRYQARPGVIDNRGQNLLFWACRYKDVDAVCRLVEAGTPLDKKDVEGCSLAHELAKTNDIETLKLILSFGMPVGLLVSPDNEGRTPGDCAFCSHPFEICLFKQTVTQSNSDASVRDNFEILDWMTKAHAAWKAAKAREERDTAAQLPGSPLRVKMRKRRGQEKKRAKHLWE